MTLLFLYLFLALFFSTLCSILEATVLSSTPSYIESMDEDNYSKKSIKLVKNMKDDIDKSISSILTLNTFAHTMGAAGVGAQAAIVFGDKWQSLVAFILTLLVLYITEIYPKTYAALYWKKFLVPTAYIISFLIKVTYPFIWFGTKITNYIKKDKKDEASFSKDEIIALVNLSEKEGTIQSKESSFIENLFKLKSIRTEDIMTPRSVVFALSTKTTVKEALEDDKLYIHTRIPVYCETIDNIVGIVFAQTILEQRIKKNKNKKLEEIMIPVHKVVEDTEVSSLIDSFLRKKSHLFVVQDSYGQTSGIVTLEDTIETLLGVEIVDEKDKFEDMQEFAKQKLKSEHNDN
ncbi:Magnesium and cobalt efflux protein CorC [Aliarcobacter thereius]|uniref:Magnesium and cobalt efflux protein CorC n=1 Tax=Aliarcobacter thereius TaxID=544718 RepID=A0A1C0B6F0_9BACT|nr:CNNM domain-containing protein [Aliarcobacter thereius]OCL98887.1 Magnesium and cobalt efflux protein CorC [Aliarcobacter thereius]